jgi:hypothetical protein
METGSEDCSEKGLQCLPAALVPEGLILRARPPTVLKKSGHVRGWNSVDEKDGKK